MSHDSEILALIQELTAVERIAVEADTSHALKAAIALRKRLKPGAELSREDEQVLARADSVRSKFLFAAQVWARIEDDIVSANRMVAAGRKHTAKLT